MSDKLLIVAAKASVVLDAIKDMPPQEQDEIVTEAVGLFLTLSKRMLDVDPSNAAAVLALLQLLELVLQHAPVDVAVAVHTTAGAEYWGR